VNVDGNETKNAKEQVGPHVDRLYALGREPCALANDESVLDSKRPVLDMKGERYHSAHASATVPSNPSTIAAAIAATARRGAAPSPLPPPTDAINTTAGAAKKPRNLAE